MRRPHWEQRERGREVAGDEVREGKADGQMFRALQVIARAGS